MRVIISSLILVLALHFLLQGINYRKYIYLYQPPNESLEKTISEKNENLCENLVSEQDNEIDVRQELLNSIQCKEQHVVAANKYVDDKNDSNFQSNVLNINRFYKKNINEHENELESVNNEKLNDKNINSFSNISQYSDQPSSWQYKNELVMNGGELLNGVTGYDNIIDQYFTYGESSLLAGCAPNKGQCNPPTRGAKLNDDLRMGLGVTNMERRSIT
mgnify:CR=1 FL=1